MDAILNHLGSKRWISFSKDDPDETFDAREKLRAYGLIEKYNEHSWRLTGEGYKALELGGFDKWCENQKGEVSKKRKLGFENFSIVNGDNNIITQATASEKARIETSSSKTPSNLKGTKWLEVVSWIVGIAAGLVAIYAFLVRMS